MKSMSQIGIDPFLRQVDRQREKIKMALDHASEGDIRLEIISSEYGGRTIYRFIVELKVKEVKE